MKPPTLLSLAIDSVVLNISHVTDLSAVPDPILVDLFSKTLSAGKLTEKVLKLFMATGNEEILYFVQSLNIKQILSPILPTRYFGYLVSSKKYIISIDDDCFPAQDPNNNTVDAVAQHLTNLRTPATPFFFNTLYDPYCSGADFVRGYPFSLRSGVDCVLSCGLWLNIADYDAPTQAMKPSECNTRYVDAVLTVPQRVMMPVSGINLGFNREVVGPAVIPGLRLAGEGKQRWETMEDIWSGMCVKVVCDHLVLGVKSGLPYVQRGHGGGDNAMESLKKEWEGVKLMEEVVPFFQSVRLPRTATTAEACVVEMAKMVKERLGAVDPVFNRAADAMEEWVRLWKAVGSQKI